MTRMVLSHFWVFFIALSSIGPMASQEKHKALCIEQRRVPNYDVQVIPEGVHLNVITNSRIVRWQATGFDQVFISEEHGIYTAAQIDRRVSGFYAIADNRILMLYDSSDRLQQSCRLTSASVGLNVTNPQGVGLDSIPFDAYTRR